MANQTLGTHAMDTMDTTTPPDFKWVDVWQLMEPEERLKATLAFIVLLRSSSEDLKEYTDLLLSSLAKRVRFRPMTLSRMPIDRLAQLMMQHMLNFFEPADWRVLFRIHYAQNKTDLMCRFLDLCQIDHDGQGNVNDEFQPPDNIHNITQKLLKEYPANEILLYFMVLLLHSYESWYFVQTELDSLRQEVSTESDVHAADPEQEEAKNEPTAELGEEFTQLDRVLIDQVITTVAGEERALTPEQLFDLVTTVHSLDTKRNRTYFHMGFMDALLPMSEPDFNRSEMNDKRREWYLAGLLAGYARKRDSEAIIGWIHQRRADFDRAASTSGGAGVTMAATLFEVLIDSGHLNPASRLLEGQVHAVSQAFRWLALAQASKLLRQGDSANAKKFLETLQKFVEQSEHQPDDPGMVHFCARVQRKLGQTYQATGDFLKARKFFEPLLEKSALVNANLLADMGLIEAGFKSLQQVSLGGDIEHRRNMLQALDKGLGHFDQANRKFGEEAVHANYLLAVRNFLDYMDGCRKDIQPDTALQFAEMALAGMLGSEDESAYAELGILGRCRFILAAMQLALLDQAQSPSVKQLWKNIDSDAGLFAEEHLGKVLDWAELVDRSLALEIGESIWKTRGQKALPLLLGHDWMVESRWLRDQLVGLARDATKPRQERFDLWTLLIPKLIRSGGKTQAEEGLDTIESLVDEDEATLGVPFLDWLEQVENTDPLWTESDRLRARYRVLRRQGKDTESFSILRNLFYSLRSQNAMEAASVLELFHEQKAPKNYWEDLAIPELDHNEQEGDVSIDQRLESGEKVRVLFIGGNETQAQYDDAIKQHIHKDWLGVEVQFEHTGWSSNWGGVVGKLKRQAKNADAVVLMSMMRTMLGRTMRAALNDPPRPWVPCTGRGRDALERSIRKAARVGLLHRLRT